MSGFDRTSLQDPVREPEREPRLAIEAFGKPSADLKVTKKTGREARMAFMKALSPQGLALAKRYNEERGFKPTENFTLYEATRKGGLVKAGQNAAIDLGGGRVLVWDWINTNTSYTSGTLVVETYSPWTVTVFDVEYYVGDDWGYATWARFIEGRDRDGNFTKAVYSPESPRPNFVRVAAGGQSNCPTDGYTWRRCLRDCLKERLTRSVWAAVMGGVASVKVCAGYALKSAEFGGWVSLGVFLGCEIGGAGMAGATSLLYEFGVRQGCSAPGGTPSDCGPNPGC